MDTAIQDFNRIVFDMLKTGPTDAHVVIPLAWHVHMKDAPNEWAAGVMLFHIVLMNRFGLADSPQSGNLQVPSGYFARFGISLSQERAGLIFLEKELGVIHRDMWEGRRYIGVYMEVLSAITAPITGKVTRSIYA